MAMAGCSPLTPRLRSAYWKDISRFILGLDIRAITAPDAFSGQDYFPDEMDRQQFYRPTDRGAEIPIGDRLQNWAKLRRNRDRRG